MMQEIIREVLEHDLGPWFRRLNLQLIDELLDSLGAWPELQANELGEDAPAQVASLWVRFLNHHVETLTGEIATLKHRHVVFMQRYDGSATREERQRHMLDYAAELGARPQDLAEDKKAFARWFDLDALKDRYHKRIAQAERRLAFALERWGSMAAMALQKAELGSHARLWERFALEDRVKPLLAHEGDERVAMAAFACLSRALQAMPAELRQTTVSDTTLQYIYRSALESRHSVGIQCAALELLPFLAMESFAIVVRKRLEQPLARNDDIFVRRKAVLLLASLLERNPDLQRLVELALEDPSPYVRQGLAKGLCRQRFVDVRPWLEALALRDREPKVRAAALVAVARTMRLAGTQRAWALELFVRALEHEGDAFALRCALTMAGDMFVRVLEDPTFSDSERTIWQQRLFPCLNALHHQAQALAVRREAARTAERIWVHGNPQARALLQRLQQELSTIRPGYSRRIAKAGLPAEERALFARVLSLLAQQDFGFDVEEKRRAWVVTRGFVFEFRFWRLWHELTHPSPDKRQAFPHLIGRRFTGTLRAPSAILAEVTPTKVPGEPLVIEEEGDWRPFLPLVDEVISALNYGIRPRPIEIYCSEGVTRMQPPRSILRRLWALLKLNFRFAEYARLRNWDHDERHAAGDYIRALEKLGFSFEHRPHTYPHVGSFEPDQSVARFFPLVLPWQSDWWARFSDYMFSAYENTLYDLLLFALLAIAAFIGRHLWINWRLRRIRKAIPLVMGGWGTRGKSGVERLKAAMFNGLGAGVISKTTGCEAMFLHAEPYRRLRELFLFRPYDKASIWEQADLLRLAGELKPDVFLWECMGLSPHYVRVLQHDWMRDDLSTITNTFPDHENLQGPAGINIPMVMSDFIPKTGMLLTSEEQMTPILRETTRRYDTAIRQVGWLEAGLLTDDVLARFPYAEHPYNIALVLAVAGELGIDEETALRHMADFVVPDIGVLKRYPVAPVQGRRLEFVNGMSANERYGCLQNWRRMGFADHDPVAEPDTWICTLVNNRADRVSRSIVFADLLVRDLAADRHFLIGTNLQGLLGYIRRAWDDYAKELTLFPADADGNGADSARKRMARAARRMRIPVHESQLVDGLRAMLKACPDEGLDLDLILKDWRDPELLSAHLAECEADWRDALLEQHRKRLGQYHEYLNFQQRILTDAEADAVGLDGAYRELLRRWFMDKLVLIEDPHATGEQIIHRIVAATPPGFLNRIMGIQNIKGTGLDFVYRWQDWERCHQACEKLRSEDPYTVGEGLDTLTAMRDFGQLCEEHLRRTIEEVRHSPLGSRQRFQAELNVVVGNLNASMEEVRHQLKHQRRQGWLERGVELVEAFIDAGDAVSRRKTANRIYRDLAAGRISHERAALELRRLTQRQKGGWLLGSLDRIRDFLRRE